VARYVLDTNVLITAHRTYYGFDICPGFWDWLLHQHQRRAVISIDKVKAEIKEGDALARWVKAKAPSSLFDSTNDQAIISEFARMMNWVQSQQFDDAAKAKFAEAADGWVMAYAKVHGDIVVTLEQYDANCKKRVPMPNVCKQFGIRYTDTFTMLRTLGAGFRWP